VQASARRKLEWRLGHDPQVEKRIPSPAADRKSQQLQQRSVARQRCAVRKGPHAALATWLSDLTDTIGFQLQLLKSLGRKPPSHDFCFPLRTQNLANFVRRSAARDSGRPILNLVTAGSHDDINRICF
jgi:hypothetical protein